MHGTASHGSLVKIASFRGCNVPKFNHRTLLLLPVVIRRVLQLITGNFSLGRPASCPVIETHCSGPRAVRFGFSSAASTDSGPASGPCRPSINESWRGIAWSHLGHKGPGSYRMPPTIEFSSQSQAHVLHRHEKEFAACCSPVFSMRERKKKVLAQRGNGSVPAPLGHCASTCQSARHPSPARAAKRRTAAPRIPAWSPTAVLTRRYLA